MSQYYSNRHAHSVGWSTWHFQWVTKYRTKIFTSEYNKNLCMIAIHEAAERHNIEVIDCEVDVDHVHVVASIPMTMTPSKAVQILKGGSSRIYFLLSGLSRRRYPGGHLWHPGKFMGSVGHITLERAKKYLGDHHAKDSA